MIFGNLESVLENEQTINEAVKENFNNSFGEIKKLVNIPKSGYIQERHCEVLPVGLQGILWRLLQS